MKVKYVKVQLLEQLFHRLPFLLAHPSLIFEEHKPAETGTARSDSWRKWTFLEQFAFVRKLKGNLQKKHFPIWRKIRMRMMKF